MNKKLEKMVNVVNDSINFLTLLDDCPNMDYMQELIGVRMDLDNVLTYVPKKYLENLSDELPFSNKENAMDYVKNMVKNSHNNLMVAMQDCLTSEIPNDLREEINNYVTCWYNEAYKELMDKTLPIIKSCNEWFLESIT